MVYLAVLWAGEAFENSQSRLFDSVRFSAVQKIPFTDQRGIVAALAASPPEHISFVQMIPRRMLNFANLLSTALV